MDTRLATKQFRIQQWAAIIKDCQTSGLRVDDYCQQHDITRDAYYYWLRKVKEAALIHNGFVEIPAGQFPDQANSSAQLVAVINGVSLEINETTSMKLLADVIGVLKHAE